MADDRTVLYALPEDQPDSLGVGTTSNQADLDATPAEKAAGGDVSSREQPNQSDTKDEWVSYAQEEHGYDPDEGLTKQELIDEYGS